MRRAIGGSMRELRRWDGEQATSQGVAQCVLAERHILRAEGVAWQMFLCRHGDPLVQLGGMRIGSVGLPGSWVSTAR